MEKAAASEVKKMNKKQWIALGCLFMLWGTGFMGMVAVFMDSYTVCTTTTNPSVLSTAIVVGIATILIFVCWMVGTACWVCGWLEKRAASISRDAPLFSKWGGEVGALRRDVCKTLNYEPIRSFGKLYKPP